MAIERIGGELGRDIFMKENKHSVAGGERRSLEKSRISGAKVSRISRCS